MAYTRTNPIFNNAMATSQGVPPEPSGSIDPNVIAAIFQAMQPQPFMMAGLADLENTAVDTEDTQAMKQQRIQEILSGRAKQQAGRPLPAQYANNPNIEITRDGYGNWFWRPRGSNEGWRPAQ